MTAEGHLLYACLVESLRMRRTFQEEPKGESVDRVWIDYNSIDVGFDQ